MTPLPAAPVTVIIPTLNEAANLGDCLASVAWAGERLVIDCGSADETRAIAAAGGARVLQLPFSTWGGQRNFAASEAHHDWVLCLDADERVSPQLEAEIRSTLAAPRHDAYRIPRRSQVLGRWIRHCGWQRDRVLRLYRRSRGRWDSRLVHERVEMTGTVGELRHHLEHFTCRDLAHFLEKSKRYGLLGGEELFRQGRRSGWLQLLSLPVYRFLKMYLLERGFLDGIPGLVVSATGAHGVFVKYARLWELERSASPANPQDQRR